MSKAKPVAGKVVAPKPEVIPDALRRRYALTDKKALGVRIAATEKKPEEIKPFSQRPITITMKLVDLDTRVEYWELTWLSKEDGLRQQRVEREVAKSPVKLGKIDAYGLPSIPGTLLQLARYLSDVETEVPVPRGYVTGRFGWQRNVEEVERWFLWGKVALAKKGQPTPPLEMLAPDNTSRGLVEACKTKGTFEAWKQAIAVVEDFPPVVVALLTALASPLLRVLEGAPFITDLAAKTSTGKTIAMTVAGSTAGQPEVKGNNRGSVVHSMKSASNVGFEFISAKMGSLPVLIDDSKTARSRRLLEQFVYQQASGSGSLRGTPEGGVRDLHKWLNTCITTGESPLATNTEAGGASARVLTIEERPFGPTSPETGRLVGELYDRVTSNYGWALPALVQYALDRQDDWGAWREQLEDEERRFLELAAGADEEIRRQSEFMAVLSVTGRLAVEAGVLPFDPTEAVEAVWHRLVGSGEDLDKPRKAMKALRSWLDMNSNRVFDRREGLADARVKFSPAVDWSEPPHGGWSGILDARDGEDFIAIPPAELSKILEQLGYRADEVRAAWLDAGWLATLPSEPTKTAMKYRPPRGAATGHVCVLLGPTDEL